MLQLTRRGFIVLGAAFGLSGCGEYIPTTVTPAVAATPAEMVDAINAVRKQNGSKPLAYSPALAGVAAGQARAMVAHDQLSHDFGPGQDLRDRATLVGYHGPIGENVAAGQTSVEETLKAWMNSAGHRYTLLSDMWTSVGMVVLSGRPGSRYGVFWAADFGTS
jgi:uncharacterized protein YkwD